MSRVGFVPNFIKARSPQKLRDFMRKNNARLGGKVEYFNPIFDGKHWYVWFYSDIVIDMQKPIEGDQ